MLRLFSSPLALKPGLRYQDEKRDRTLYETTKTKCGPDGIGR